MRILGGRHEQGAGAPAAGWGCDRPRLPPDADSAYARTATMVRRRRRVNLLELTRLEVAYGGIRAVKGIDLHVRKGELVCLIGTNGAGKTTTLKAIAGLLPVATDAILYDGAAVGGRAPLRVGAPLST